jgi:hypothetical protein
MAQLPLDGTATWRHLSRMSGDTFVISGLRERRSAVAGRIVDMRREIDKLQADLLHLDAVLKLYGLEPAEIPNKGRMPVRSAYFGRNEISRRCRDMLRDKGTVRADDVAVLAMQEKGLDPEAFRAANSKLFLALIRCANSRPKCVRGSRAKPWCLSRQCS